MFFAFFVDIYHFCCQILAMVMMPIEYWNVKMSSECQNEFIFRSTCMCVCIYAWIYIYSICMCVCVLKIYIYTYTSMCELVPYIGFSLFVNLSNVQLSHVIYRWKALRKLYVMVLKRKQYGFSTLEDPMNLFSVPRAP